MRIAGRRKHIYAAGISSFLRAKPQQLDHVCFEIKKIIARHRNFAVDIFGSQAVHFFESLEPHSIC
jgi:hypothetical protein